MVRFQLILLPVIHVFVLNFTGINIAGVKWVVRFQLILLIVMFLSVMDFLVGSFVHSEPGKKNTQYLRNGPNILNVMYSRLEM